MSDLSGAVDTSGVTGADVVAALIVVAATLLVAWLVGRMTHRYLARPGTTSLQVAAMGARAAKGLVYFIGGALALSFLGLRSDWFALTLALVGVLVVMIAKPMLEKFAAGAALVTRPAFSVGDDVGINDMKGTVLEITSRSTVLRLRDGRRVHIPNTEVVGETIIVYTTDRKRRTAVDLEVDGRHSIPDIEAVLLAALSGVEEVARDPAPVVRARGFGNAVSLSVRFWHDSGLGDEGKALDQAVRAMDGALRNAGMSLASGSLVVDLAGGIPPGAGARPDHGD